MVLPADNGRTYRTKMSTLIEKKEKAPTDCLTRKSSEKLLTLKRDVYQTPFTTKSDLDTNSLPKIHKADVPLRSTMLTYITSYFLSQVTRFTVTNSAHFVTTISSETILKKIMVSFDVESLFTNVTINAAVQAALEKLEKLEDDPSLICKATTEVVSGVSI